MALAGTALTMTQPPTAASPVVRRGEVWRVRLDPTQGAEIQKTRHTVILSANGLNRACRTVGVVPLSTGPTPRPLRSAQGGMPIPSACDNCLQTDLALARHGDALELHVRRIGRRLWHPPAAIAAGPLERIW